MKFVGLNIKVKVFAFFCNYVLFLKILSITLFKGNGNFDPENVHRKPLLILKIVPEAGCDVYTAWKNQPIEEKLRRQSTNDREEQLNKNSENVYLFFSLKTICVCTESIDII
jgi:hypothetical protein